MSVIAIILSSWRNDTIVFECITAALKSPAISEVHVWGHEPTSNAQWHSMPETPYHTGLARYIDKFTNETLVDGNKHASEDNTNTIAKRANITLNMWAVLHEARERFPDNTLVYMEDDAIIKPRVFERHLWVFLTSNNTAASCYGETGTTYTGNGSVCFFFKPGSQPALQHLLAYHMVQPASSILFDHSRNKWPVYDAVTHGFPTSPATRL